MTIDHETNGRQINSPTNGDKIRAMSDEEMADFFHNMVHYEKVAVDGDGTDSYLSVQFDGDERDTDMPDSYGDILEWLKK